MGDESPALVARTRVHVIVSAPDIQGDTHRPRRLDVNALHATGRHLDLGDAGVATVWAIPAGDRAEPYVVINVNGIDHVRIPAGALGALGDAITAARTCLASAGLP